jgi:hypothetical protein
VDARQQRGFFLVQSTKRPRIKLYAGTRTSRSSCAFAIAYVRSSSRSQKSRSRSTTTRTQTVPSRTPATTCVPAAETAQPVAVYGTFKGQEALDLGTYGIEGINRHASTWLEEAR